MADVTDKQRAPRSNKGRIADVTDKQSVSRLPYIWYPLSLNTIFSESNNNSKP